jgi:hypothetical protein
MVNSNIEATDSSFDPLAVIFGVVFLLVSGFMLYQSVGQMAITQNTEVYSFLGFLTVPLVFDKT